MDLTPATETTNRRTGLLDRRQLLGGAALAGLVVAPTALVGAPLLERAQASTMPAAAPRLTRRSLDAVVTRALGPASASTGVTVIDRRTGVWMSHNGSLQVQMASTGKVLVLVAFLRRRRLQGRSLSSGDRRLVQAMIRWSDNDAATTLWRAAGGSSVIAPLARRLGMPTTAASIQSRGAWGASFTTSDDQAKLMATIAAGGRGIIHSTDAAYVLSEMRQVTSSQAWGAGIVRSRTVSVAVKNGWSPFRPDNRWRVNTLGLTRGDGRDYVIAAYEKNLPSMQRGVDRKNAVVRAVHAALAQPLRVS